MRRTQTVVCVFDIGFALSYAKGGGFVIPCSLGFASLRPTADINKAITTNQQVNQLQSQPRGALVEPKNQDGEEDIWLAPHVTLQQ